MIDRLSVAEQLADLQEVSPVIAEYISNGLFKETFGKDVDYSENDLLIACYQLLLEDFPEYGLVLSQPLDEITQDWYTAKHYYYLRKFVDRNNLIQLLMNSENLLDQLEAQLADEDVGSFFNRTLEIFKDARPDDETLDFLLYISPTITSTERYTAHFQACIDVAKQQLSYRVIPDLNLAQLYIEHIQENREIFADRILRFIDGNNEFYLRNLDRARIARAQATYDLDKITPTEIRYYATVDSPDFPTPTPELRKFKDDLMLAHHRRSMHHIEYYVDPAKNPRPLFDLTALVIVACAMAEKDVTPDEFRKRAYKCRKIGGDLFTEEVWKELTLNIFPRLFDKEQF